MSKSSSGCCRPSDLPDPRSDGALQHRHARAEQELVLSGQEYEENAVGVEGLEALVLDDV